MKALHFFSLVPLTAPEKTGSFFEAQNEHLMIGTMAAAFSMPKRGSALLFSNY
jgi:hypothetical protein